MLGGVRRERETASSRWHHEITGDNPQKTRTRNRREEVVANRIKLGYNYGWQRGIRTPEERKRCRLCSIDGGHSLEHYLRDCVTVSELRNQCEIADPTLVDYAKHFLAILPLTLKAHPKFCDIKN